MRSLTCGLLFALAPCAQAAPCSSLDDLRWLLGEWTADSGARTIVESWREVSPVTFEGSGVTTAKADGKVVDGETLRLVAMSDAVFYVAKVAHNPFPVPFRLTTCEPGRLVFENLAHDFPRRLEYLRLPDGGLAVHISDAADRGFSLQFRARGQP